MEVKIRKLCDSAVVPSYAHDTDAGLDITATSKSYDADGNVVYGTGLAMEIPYGHVGLLFSRSSNAKKQLLLSNGVGVIDAGYRGEITFKFKRTPPYDESKEYNVGDRIGQLIIMPYPKIDFVVCETLSGSERGVGGYGSSGK